MRSSSCRQLLSECRLPITIVLDSRYASHPVCEPECRSTTTPLEYCAARIDVVLEKLDSRQRHVRHSRVQRGLSAPSYCQPLREVAEIGGCPADNLYRQMESV